MKISGKYNGFTITLELGGSVGLEKFEATKDNYGAQITALRKRDNVPVRTCDVIEELFKSGAIVKCKISFGRKVELVLPDRDDNGRTLYAKDAHDRFKRAFSETAKQEIDLEYAHAGSDIESLTKYRGGRSRRDMSGIWKGLGELVDGVADALYITALVKFFLGDD